MKKRKLSFIYVYIIYFLLLVAAVIACVAYVNSILRQYEEGLPEKHMEAVVDELVADASEEKLWSKYSLPKIEPGSFEEHLDLQKEYYALYTDGNVEFSQMDGTHAEDELYYTVETDGFVLAEVKLKAMGPTVTKLAVLSFREWQVEYVKPIVEASEYTVSVPADFHVRVNGIPLETQEGVVNDEITYTISGVYLEPDFEITDNEGNEVKYAIENKQVIAEFYHYSLTLPAALTVELNGDNCQGEAIDGKRIRYDIRLLTKPMVTISDYYGNAISYEGGDELPLTYMTISADSRYTIEVSGQPIPREAVTTLANPEYEQLAEYVEDLPQISEYDIAILENDAEIIIKDEKGNSFSLDPGKTVQDFTSRVNSLEEVPEEVKAEIDVLDIAQKWSLFMSDDVPFRQIEKYLIANSYQHEVAVQYATGEDITFTSEHSLANPAFTDNAVANFVWITDNCFSVDIRFVKHMILTVGTKVDDPMNDRFYFVKYDDTDDNMDNPIWKIVGMKEIVNNER